ncbi:cytochrome b5 domain-containing protein [Macrococcus caseolyticus]|nr:cytochrome b5 domain-containing protein [Macrococcus caseolyticus]RKO12491.1 cytochrome b5 domain-containing protein [Macrococcus caseolyticus]
MLTWFLVGFVALIVYLGFIRDSGSPAIEEPDAIEVQDFTPMTLQKYNGKDDPHVLVAINGKVFDVTSGKAHYGPQGSYAAFAGRDASRGLAKHSFDPEMLTPLDQPIDTLSDITESEREALEQWEEFFSGKYPYCGRLVNP